MNTSTLSENTRQHSTTPEEHISLFNRSGNDGMASTPWYYGILKEDTMTNQDFEVKIIDNGGSIAFVLPKGTAQFAEMFVLDTTGNLVWKTQSFNSGTIIWDKHTLFGRSVPKGIYTFLMKQSNRQLNGTIEISQ